MLPNPTPSYSVFQKWLPRSLGTRMLLLMVDSALRSSSSMEAIEDVRDREGVVVVDYSGSYHVETLV